MIDDISADSCRQEVRQSQDRSNPCERLSRSANKRECQNQRRLNNTESKMDPPCRQDGLRAARNHVSAVNSVILPGSMGKNVGNDGGEHDQQERSATSPVDYSDDNEVERNEQPIDIGTREMPKELGLSVALHGKRILQNERRDRQKTQ
jgi:hypothetical protein